MGLLLRDKEPDIAAIGAALFGSCPAGENADVAASRKRGHAVSGGAFPVQQA
jgi:hypothetical protein